MPATATAPAPSIFAPSAMRGSAGVADHALAASVPPERCLTQPSGPTSGHPRGWPARRLGRFGGADQRFARGVARYSLVKKVPTRFPPTMAYPPALDRKSVV